jgi:dihydropteroate synthase
MTLLSPIGRTRVMGVINVTPDSFSDGGQWMDPDDAVRHGLAMVADGADVIDVGGESTRPGAIRIDADEELRRVIPVIRALAAEGVTVSIDTMRADVAARAVEAGARMINDVSGGKADPRMFEIMADTGVDVVLMHWRAHSVEMVDHAVYGDVVAEVAAELETQCAAAAAAGVDPGRIVVDPGLGFAKNAEHNWELLRRIDELVRGLPPVLIGASRKRFLGELLDGRDVDGREHATTAITALVAAEDVWGVRVHDVRAARDAIAVCDRMGLL